MAKSRKARAGLAAALQPFVDNNTLAGAVLLAATKDEVIALEAVGYADVAARVPMRTDALFWIASQTKSMTATVVMMLVEEGKISVEDPVEKYLPEFKGQMVRVEADDDHVLLRRPSHPITVREVLTHTSGLPFWTAVEEPLVDRLPLAVAARSYAMGPLLFEPGIRYEYSNAGINTAARILEVVSGTAYEEFLASRLLKPLGMKDTTFWPTARQVKRLAKSYKPNAEKNGLEETLIYARQYPLSDRTRRYPGPAGGLFSTAGDCARFCRMVLCGGEFGGRRYLAEATVRQMTSKQTPEAVKDGYGFGWGVAGGTFGHGGAYSTDMNIDPARGIITVFLVQHAGFPNGEEGEKVRPAFRMAVDELLKGKA